ncbi:MAG: YfhO family protein [Candidatus Andersenbacteria bacterium]|nr:YfhO family protein [Candidatus Andersenbacteria bacterium]
MTIKPQFIGIGLVLITWLTFFSPIISGQQMYFLDDLKIIYYPIETIYAQFQHHWQLPLWSNEFGFGQPLLEWGQLGFFTPVHVLLRALYVPPLILLQASVVIYFLIGSVSMYAYLRRRLFHPAAASLGAILFAYCGFMIGHLNHVNFYTSTMLLPLLLITIDIFLAKATLKNSATIAITAAAVAMSGQPQVVAYVFFIAGVIGLTTFIPTIKHNIKGAGKKIALTIFAGILGFCLSALAILPLQEFVPETERAGGLPYTELFEFSYPPYETITLLFPYFFGDHDHYNGPKGFQELAAYTGIIPIMLAGIALTSWKKRKVERIAGIILVITGIALVLGQYSFIYHYLVDNHYIQTVGVVGRFVFFFDIGILLLAVAGLQDIIEQVSGTALSKTLRIAVGIITPVLLIAAPFWMYATQDANAFPHLQELASLHHITIWLIITGITTVIASFFSRKILWAIPVVAAVTLLAYGWNYNPRVSTHEALSTSPFIADLSQFKIATGLPARLYAAEHLPVTGNPHVKITLSDYISPKFSVFQPLQVLRPNLSCLVVPIQSDSAQVTHLTVMLRSGFDGTIWYQTSISSEDAFKNTDQTICFPQIPQSDQQNLMLSFTSDETTNMKVFVSPSINSQSNVYFMRVQKPSPRQITESKKPLSVQYTAQYPLKNDLENSLLVRNMQALAGASSARWIGALSIRPYRAFVDGFFANDSDAFDGDGIHALTRNRSLVNLVGITHFTQSLDYGQTNDPMVDAGYKVVDTADTGDNNVRLYENTNAYPKAFMVPHAQFIAADDDTRALMRDPKLDPKSLVYISAPTPPDLTDNQPNITMQASATITKYSETRVDVHVDTNKTAYLVLNDATLPQWQTYIDDKPAPQMKADTMFKAAQVPAGSHVVSFRYSSPATKKAEILTIIGIVICIAIYSSGLVRKK